MYFSFFFYEIYYNIFINTCFSKHSSLVFIFIKGVFYACLRFKNGLPLFKALGSEIRIKIFRLIQSQEGLNLKQIAQALGMPVTTLSPHITLLKECGLICILDKPMAHGVQKCCFADTDAKQLIIDIPGDEYGSHVYSAEIPVGNFTDFSVAPTCGLATSFSFIGQPDEPRYFGHPSRYHAKIIWFTTGYLEYVLPNFIPGRSKIESLSLSFEISSECPNYNDDWPSDITFSINGTTLGTWISPGDYGSRRGRLNPDWWFSFMNQYGLLKKLTINHQGTFIDKDKLSDVTIDQLAFTDQSVLKFRFSVLPDAAKPNGCTLFGSGFGDYNQGIQVTFSYSPLV